MNKFSIGQMAFLIVVISMLMSSCQSCTTSKDDSNGPQPLNLSVYLDLSDRLIREMAPNQTYRDTAVINYLVDYFVKNTMGPQILKSQNKMKVFFYPTPNNSEIAMLAQGLSVDIGSKQGVARREALDAMKGVFQNSLSHIYEETLEEKNWIGCDIWDFFSSKKVDNLCIKPGARNILVILTDGYIFASNNKIKEGNAYSYILPQTLSAGGLLIDRRKGDLGGKGLEVLMLEVNPYDPKQRDVMVSTIEEWFSSMGIEKFVVAETEANLTNTKTIIDNFLGQ